MPQKKSLSRSDYDKYLSLPFEIYFSGPIYYTSMELISYDAKIKKITDLLGVFVEQGRAYGVSFYCPNNTGAELYCCMTGNHDDINPKWLDMVDEDDLNMNDGYTFAIEIDAEGINLSAGEIEDFDLSDSTGESIGYYKLEDECPDYIVLDPEGDRIKIDCEGYLLDDDGEVDENTRVINVDKLGEIDSMQNFSTFDTEEAQDEWIKELWRKYFPKAKTPKIKEYIQI